MKKRRTTHRRRVGDEVVFKNDVGTYRAKILTPLGEAGAGPGAYVVRIIAGPNMHNWVVDLPKTLIVHKRRRR